MSATNRSIGRKAVRTISGGVLLSIAIAACENDLVAPADPGWFRAEIVSGTDTTQFYGLTEYGGTAERGSTFYLSSDDFVVGERRTFNLFRAAPQPGVGDYSIGDTIDYYGGGFTLRYEKETTDQLLLYSVFEGTLSVIHMEEHLVIARFEGTAQVDCLIDYTLPWDAQTYPCPWSEQYWGPYNLSPTAEVRGSFLAPSAQSLLPW